MDHDINPLIVLLLEGVLHTNGLNSTIKSSEINYGEITRIILLGENNYPLVVTTNIVRFYRLKESGLRSVLFKLASLYPQQMDIIQELEKYYFVLGTK